MTGNVVAMLPFPALLSWGILLAIGLAMLLVAADHLTNAGETLGIIMGMPSYIIGVTIVAFGTSLPEMVSSIIAVLEGATEIVSGNVVGSNFANLSLVLPLGALVGGVLVIKQDLMRFDLPALLAASIALMLISIDGTITRLEAIMCLVGLSVVIFVALDSRGQAGSEEEQRTTDADGGPLPSVWKPLGVLALAAFGVWIGATVSIESVMGLSAAAGYNTAVMAAIVVALGTSVPEIFVSITAARKGQADMMIGNIIGSNVFNVFAVVGVSGMLGNLVVPDLIARDGIAAMMAITILSVLILINRRMTGRHALLILMFYPIFVIEIMQLASG